MESELHLRDWFVPRRKELKDGTGLADMTVDCVWSTRLVVVEQGDAYGAIESCGFVDIGYIEGEFQQRVGCHSVSLAGPSDNSSFRDISVVASKHVSRRGPSAWAGFLAPGENIQKSKVR